MSQGQRHLCKLSVHQILMNCGNHFSWIDIWQFAIHFDSFIVLTVPSKALLWQTTQWEINWTKQPIQSAVCPHFSQNILSRDTRGHTRLENNKISQAIYYPTNLTRETVSWKGGFHIHFSSMSEASTEITWNFKTDFQIPPNLYYTYKLHKIPPIKCFLYCLAVVFAPST